MLVDLSAIQEEGDSSNNLLDQVSEVKLDFNVMMSTRVNLDKVDFMIPAENFDAENGGLMVLA